MLNLIYSDLFDRERYTILSFDAVVSDGVASRSVPVDISLLDINDNTPTFIQMVYTFTSVNETAPIGYTVGQVEATDTDSGDNSRISYQITKVTNNLVGTLYADHIVGVDTHS